MQNSSIQFAESANTTAVDYYSQKQKNRPYHPPTPGKITIVAMTPTTDSAVPEPTLCLGLRQCYFNSAMFVTSTSESDLTATVNNCSTVGLAPFFRCEKMETESTVCKKFIEFLAKQEKVAGVWLSTPTLKELISNLKATSDKPNATIFNYDLLSTAAENYNKIVVMDAFADKSKAGGNYREYLMDFQDYVKPSSWGMTTFPTYKIGNTEVDNRDLFYRNLEILSLISRYCLRPFRFTVRCQSFMDPSSNKAAITPTEEEMRYTAFSALAYGAQGL